MREDKSHFSLFEEKNQIKSTLDQLRLKGNITINSVGFGRDHDSQLMTKICDLRDEKFS